MPAIRPTRRRRSPLLLAMVSLAAILAGGAGTLAVLIALGHLSWPLWKTETKDDHAGMVAIPISAREIPAYSKITLTDLVDPETGALKVTYLPPQRVPEEAILSPTQIVGRVMRRDKSQGFAFKEDEFLPEGTRPGVAGGIPPGKRALTLSAEKIGGVRGLNAGDQVDLVASAAVDEGKQAKRRRSDGRTVVFPATATAAGSQADVRVLAHEAVIVIPVTTRAIPITSNSLMEGARTATRPVQEVVIAVSPDEVMPLSEALATEMEVTAVLRSGHPDDPGEVRIAPGSGTQDELKSTEVIIGGERKLYLYESKREQPVRPASTDSTSIARSVR